MRGLYGMIDLPSADSPDPLPFLHALLDGGARTIQLRMKGASAGSMLAVVERLRPICRGRARFIVNDRLDVALAGGADGVHLGQDDLSLEDARKQVPRGFLIGISTHDEAQARRAQGADYLGFGPIFPTTSKDRPDPVVGIEQLRSICRASSIPVVAIGGISLASVPDLVSAGAAAVAIIGAIRNSDDVTAAVRQVNAAFGLVAPSPAPATRRGT